MNSSGLRGGLFAGEGLVKPEPSWAVPVGVSLSTVLALATGLMRYFLGSPPERQAGGLLATVALAALVALPAVLATLATRRGPEGLLLSAGVLALLSMFLTWSVTLAMIIPAVLFLSSYVSLRHAGRTALFDGSMALTTAALMVVGIAVLFLRQDPVEYATATEAGAVGDVITISEALPSLAASLLVVVLGVSVRLLHGRHGHARGAAST